MLGTSFPLHNLMKIVIRLTFTEYGENTMKLRQGKTKNILEGFY